MNELLTQNHFTCSSEELFTLASMLGGETLIGIPDPFPGWLTEEIEAAVSKSCEELVQRGYLQELNGEMSMDILVAALVATVIEPEVAIILTMHHPPAMPQQELFYRRSPLIVHLHPSDGLYTLTALSSSQEILSLIWKAWGLGAQKAAKGKGFSVPQEALDSVREALGQGEQEARRVLRLAGVELGSARAFVRTLQTGVRNGTLIALRPLETTWQVEGIGILEGENGLWWLRPFHRQTAEWVECTPCSAAELREEIGALLERFIPLEE